MHDKVRQNVTFVFFDFPSLSRAENAATLSSRFLHPSGTGSAWVGAECVLALRDLVLLLLKQQVKEDIW